MATARCYTKSGSVNKYESNLWSSPSSGNWSSGGIVGNITTPDSNGNYTVTPAPEYEDSNTPTKFYCTTIYGGVRKTFYFKESIKEIVITTGVGFFTNNGIKIFLTFNNNEYLGNDKLHVMVEVTANNPLALIDSVFFTIDKNSRGTLDKEIYLKPNYNRVYYAKITSCRPMGGKNYRVLIT